jgi:DNA-binding transcriptional ArsR family regulator
VHPLAVEVMNEIKIDISSQQPKGAKDFLGKRPVQHAIVVCESAEPQCPRLWPLPTERIYWPLQNPAAVTGTKKQRLAAFRTIRDQLSTRISEWLAERLQHPPLIDSDQAVASLAALAQESRLAVFRLLVRTGDNGMAAGEIAEALAIPANTLSFHLGQLLSAGLVSSRREGRSIIYHIRTEGVRSLLHYLTENCCEGKPELCQPAAVCDGKAGTSINGNVANRRTKQGDDS